MDIWAIITVICALLVYCIEYLKEIFPFNTIVLMVIAYQIIAAKEYLADIRSSLILITKSNTAKIVVSLKELKDDLKNNRQESDE